MNAVNGNGVLSSDGVWLAVLIMDSAYLKKTVGDLLSRGIAEVVAQQPPDPVEYLARFLLHYQQQRIKDEQVCVSDEG